MGIWVKGVWEFFAVALLLSCNPEIILEQNVGGLCFVSMAMGPLLLPGGGGGGAGATGGPWVPGEGSRHPCSATNRLQLSGLVASLSLWGASDSATGSMWQEVGAVTHAWLRTPPPGGWGSG